MTTPERSPERDAAVEALLPHVASQGWSIAALRAAAGPDADLLFPGGPADIVEAYIDLGDRWMEQDTALMDLSGLRLPARVRTVIAARLARNNPHKDAIRRALGILARPGNGLLAARCTARTVDAIWHAAGDKAADFSWYSKRVILTGIYGATLLYWLRDGSAGGMDTLAFLDRRLAGVGQIGRVRRRLGSLLGRA